MQPPRRFPNHFSCVYEHFKGKKSSFSFILKRKVIYRFFTYILFLYNFVFFTYNNKIDIIKKASRFVREDEQGKRFSPVYTLSLLLLLVNHTLRPKIYFFCSSCGRDGLKSHMKFAAQRKRPEREKRAEVALFQSLAKSVFLSHFCVLWVVECCVVSECNEKSSNLQQKLLQASQI